MFFVVGLVMYSIGQPIAAIMTAAENFLSGMEGSSKVVLGFIMGSMLAFDMGGPVNKVVFSLMVSTIGEGIYSLAGPIAVGIAVPPMACGVASMIAKNKFSPEERETGKSAIIMGAVGITEGAIPFAASRPIKGYSVFDR